MKNFFLLLVLLVSFTNNVFSQCTVNFYGEYGNMSPTCGNGVFGAWSSTTWVYSREYSIVNVVAGNTYEFQTYRTSNFASRFATITTTANVPLVWGTTTNVIPISWTATFTGQVRFWTHSSNTCGSSTVNQTRRVRCNEPPPPCVGTLVTLNMNDSYGDGWNGGQLTISGNLGNIYGPYTLSTGFSSTLTICLPDDCYSIDVTGGSYPGEISWSITNGGTSLANGGAPTTLNDAFSIGSAICIPPTPGPCLNTVSYVGSDLPTQANPSVQALCLGLNPPFGQFTDEYTEWTNGVAGVNYIVISSVATDWITVTSNIPNGNVVAFGSSPLIWTSPTNGTHYIHVNTDGFCGEDFNCRDITVERSSVLPVTLISFTVECYNNMSLLEWATASEQNSDYFQVERSRNGHEWTEVSKISTVGNSSVITNYQFYDTTANFNVTGYYYRLKQVDFDGQFEYFETKYILCEDDKTTKEIKVFPNPTEGDIFVGLKNNNVEEATFLIVDNTGRAIFTVNVNLTDAYTVYPLNMSDIQSGTYTLYILTKNNNFLHKIIKK